MRYIATYQINGGTRFEGCESASHNAALHNTRRLFSGQGYRVVRDESHTGHLVIAGPAGRAVIDIETAN